MNKLLPEDKEHNDTNSKYNAKENANIWNFQSVNPEN